MGRYVSYPGGSTIVGRLIGSLGETDVLGMFVKGGLDVDVDKEQLGV